MKFMILVKSNPDIEARLAKTSPAEMKEQMAEMEKFNDELRKAGAMKDCDGLTLSNEGKRVRFEGTSRTVVDGPFTGASSRVTGSGSCRPWTTRWPG